jgi:hypothetical protein
MPDLKSRARGNPYYENAGMPVRKPAKPSVRPAATAAPAQKTESETARAARAIVEAGKKALPPAMKATKTGAIKTLTFLGWAGMVIAKETPPLMRKLKAFGIEAYQYLRKASADAMERYRRSRENRQEIEVRKEPGPPVTASRDSDEGTVENSTTRPF